MNTNALKKRIMTRVYILFTIQKLKNPVVFELLILGISFLVLGFMVSFQNIAINASNNISSSYGFWTNAFIGTNLSVKIITLIIICATGLILKNATKKIYTNTTNRLLVVRA